MNIFLSAHWESSQTSNITSPAWTYSYLMGLTSEELMKRLCKPLRQLIIGYVKWIWIYFEETINTQCLENIWLNLWKITRVFLEVCVAAVWLLENLSIIIMKITAMSRGTHLAELQAMGKWAETYTGLNNLQSLAICCFLNF